MLHSSEPPGAPLRSALVERPVAKSGDNLRPGKPNWQAVPPQCGSFDAQRRIRLLLGVLGFGEDDAGAIHQLHLLVERHRLRVRRQSRRRANVHGAGALERVDHGRLAFCWEGADSEGASPAQSERPLCSTK